MFESILRDARHAASSLIATYLGRAVVAIPFFVAASFATAAVTLALVERFGAQFAYLLLAMGFTLIGILAAIIVTAKEKEAEAPAAPEAEDVDSGSDNGAESILAPAAAMLMPIISPLLTSSMGVSTILRSGKWAIRNVPLLVLAAMLAVLAWPTNSTDNAGNDSPGDRDGSASATAEGALSS